MTSMDTEMWLPRPRHDGLGYSANRGVGAFIVIDSRSNFPSTGNWVKPRKVIVQKRSRRCTVAMTALVLLPVSSRIH
jgi:hypothetical protein